MKHANSKRARKPALFDRLTLTQMHTLTGLHPSMFEKWIATGQLAPGKHFVHHDPDGPLIIFPAFTAWLQAQPSTPPPPPPPKRPAPRLDQPAQLYHHYDKDGSLLYVGIASHVFGRLRGHKNSSPWFLQIVRVDIEHFPTREECLAAELKAIREELPQFNTQGMPHD